MTTKIITTYVAGGYTIAAYNNLIVTNTGGVGGSGVAANYFSNILNDGRISGNDVGITFGPHGGALVNGSAIYTSALIEGAYGVKANSYISISNYGTIKSAGTSLKYSVGIELLDGGSIDNGSVTDHSALVEGYSGVDIGYFSGSGAVTNFGTIRGLLQTGVVMIGAGSVTNGAVTDTAASISGVNRGVQLDQTGTVTNFGEIAIAGATAGDFGVWMLKGGRVINGGAGDTSAQISGYSAVWLSGAGTVINFGAISGLGELHGDAGVELTVGGAVVNGAAASPGATIAGYSGVILGAAGTVANYGTINGFGVAANELGVYLTGGGTVINGAGTDRKATIEGAAGVAIIGAAGTVRNGGTIQATDNSQNAFGALLGAGGTIVNGSANNHVALIQGAAGLYLVGGSGQNFGTISGVGDSGAGVKLASGASITNGAPGHTNAIVEGYNGVSTPTGAAATVTNFGTIEGTNAAVYFRSSTDVLAVEAGSTFLGAIYGGGGTIDLASGVGTISNLFAVAGVVVSGSMAATTFKGFGTVEIGLGATFTDTAAVTIVAGQTVNTAGTLTLGAAAKGAITNGGVIEANGVGVLILAGTVINTGTIAANTGAVTISAPLSGSGGLAVNGGTMIVSGAVTGTGKETINGGLLEFASTFTESVTFTGTLGVLELAQSQAYTGTITGFSKTGSTSLDLLDVSFVSASEATYSGTTSGGVLTVTDGTHTARINLKGNYTTSTFVASSDGHGGVLIVDPKSKASTTSPLTMLSAMAGMGATVGEVVHSVPARSVHDIVLMSPRTLMS